MNTIQQIEEVPVPDITRRRTDVCCTIWAVLFSVTLLVYAIAAINTGNLIKTNFPTDGAGKLCGREHSAYHYVYYPTPSDVTKRLCVKKCPTGSEVNLKCQPAAGLSCEDAEKYETEPVDTRYGHYCFPKNQQIREKLIDDAGLDDRQGFVNAYETIWFSFWLSLGLGLLFALLVQFMPRMAGFFAVVGGGIALLAFGVLLLNYPNAKYAVLKFWWAVLAIIGGICLLLAVWFYRAQMRITSILLYHSTRLLMSNSAMALYVPIFIVLAFGLLGLTIFEFLSFWSIPDPQFNPLKPFYTASGSGYVFLSVLVFIQLYWGLAFLKEFFSFCISGNAVTWYFGRQACNTCYTPVFRALRFHFGSIVAAGFMVGFFSIPEFLVSLIKVKNQVMKPVNPFSSYGRCYYAVFGWADSLFDLVRADAMAYINISGLPYCNAARYCEFLCHNTRLFAGSQSLTMLYRFGAHALLTSAVAIVALRYKGFITVPGLFFISILSLFLITYFISLHADAAEGLMTTFLAEEYLEFGDLLRVKRAAPELVQELSMVLATTPAPVYNTGVAGSVYPGQVAGAPLMTGSVMPGGVVGAPGVMGVGAVPLGVGYPLR